MWMKDGVGGLADPGSIPGGSTTRLESKPVQALTERQKLVVEIIQNSLREKGFPPTLREIGKIMGIRSTKGVKDHLQALARKGYVVHEQITARGIKLTPAGAALGQPDPGIGVLPGVQVVSIPVVSRIQKGLPILHEPFLIDTVTVDPTMFRPSYRSGEVFGLRMHGDAMIQAGLVEGDYVFVRQQKSAMSGDIAVVLVGDEAIVRRYFRTATQVRLEPAHKGMASLYMRNEDVQPHMILGVVIGIFRPFRRP